MASGKLQIKETKSLMKTLDNDIVDIPYNHMDFEDDECDDGYEMIQVTVMIASIVMMKRLSFVIHLTIPSKAMIQKRNRKQVTMIRTAIITV